MRRKKAERGATILESLICIMLLCLIFFGLMQIFQWSMAQMLTEYSSFYAAKAYSLGYSRSIVERASRIAITGASGRDVSGTPVTAPFTQTKLSNAASEYMSYGQYGSSAINYEYWEPDNITSDTPLVEISYSNTGSSTIDGRVRVKNMPLLAENLNWIVGGATEANPTGEASTFNHASLYLEND
jgi:hypothetical protein